MCRIKVYIEGSMFIFKVKFYLVDQSFCIGFKAYVWGQYLHIGLWLT